MKKIFICIPTLESAGAERFVTELACNLNRDKFEPIIVVTNRLNESTTFCQKLIKENIRVLDVSNENYFSEILNIRQILCKERPDIVHTNIGALLHMLVPVFLFARGTKHLFTVHSMGYRIFSGIKRLLVAMCFHTKLVTPVAISDIVKQSVVEAYNLSENDVELVYNGVDTNKFSPQKENTIEQKVTFVSVGTLYHIKNHQLLIDAFSILHKTMKDTTLRIVGSGELYNQLYSQVEELGLHDAVFFEGNQSDVQPYLNSASIYCCTSKVEGLPISVLEAMACGLPIISTPAGGVVDIVKNDENGYIVNADPKQLAEKMENLAKNIELQRMFSKKSREMAVELDIHVCAKKYEKLYEKYSRH